MEPELPLISLRLPLVLTFTVGLLALAGCDKEPRAPAQQESAATPSPSAQGPAAPDDGSEGKIDRSHKGSKMPDITVHDAKGAKLRLLSLVGKPVLINLWATWCGPCVRELPTLDALAVREQGRLAVLTVSQDSGQPDKVAAKLSAQPHLPVWLDPENDLGFFYNTGVLPTSVLYDAQGREVWRMVGGHDWSGADTQALLAEAK
ncbi:thioredoxin family protein [Novosphingobium nitrogenifigens DSM 19370]|uniref:Thioredoxin family protein n=1 Tax=Novosphingobium nitrogenifigens DSM 19370 TaxID=983920 RepID=F1Z6T3_9SPHN|nr:thioredoxin family protein [Novosphingobium nitrogenifigens DSM 19370]